MNKKVGIGVGVLIWKDNKVLMIHRASEHGYGTWSTPGGHVDHGETPFETAIRECMEETNVVIKNPRFKGFTNDVFDQEKHYITIWMEVDYAGGEPRINSRRELDEIGWYPMDNLPKPLFQSMTNLVNNKLVSTGDCMTEVLTGGRHGIYKKDEFVYRPYEVWTESVHKFLMFLHEHGFDKVPYPYGKDSFGKEKLSYVSGEIYNGLLPEEVKSLKTLKSVATLMREYHVLGSQYVNELEGDETWMLSLREPVETMCHGDFAPYNVAITNSEASGIIDFDTLHPGPKMWDVAYALYRWIPLMAPSNPESFGSEENKKDRLHEFMVTYGQEEYTYKDTITWVIKRLQALVDYMETQAKSGNETFIHCIEEGHQDIYVQDIDYLKGLL